MTRGSPSRVPDTQALFLQDDEETQAGIASLAEDAAKDPGGVAREMFASRKLISWLSNSYKEMAEGRRDDGEVARLGKALHARVGEMMWDTLTLTGQADLAITDVRESKLVECLTPAFASTVRNAGMLSTEVLLDYLVVRIAK